MLTIQNLIRNFSSERLSTYLNLTSNSETAAFELYEFNIKLSESFYPSLHNLEISLRNNFHQSLSKTYGENWFLNNTLLVGSKNKNPANIAKVAEVISKLKPVNLTKINSNDVISNLSFGFWVSLLFNKYELDIWRPCLRNIFPINQKITRNNIQHKLELIKLIRNRIAHHECILKHDLPTLHQTIYEILEYLSPELSNWSSNFDRFPKIFAQYQTFKTKFQA
ncbi:MAG: Abi family protein [Pseudomonadota bacterium]